MRHALIEAERSTCSRAAVGVVIAKQGRILSTGYNGAPAGMEHCNHDCDCDPVEAQDMNDRWVSGHQLGCNATQPCTVAIHAEANAVGYAARHGVKLNRADLYTTFCPCLPCAQLIVTVGILRVFYKHEYRDHSGLELLKNAAVDIVML